MTSTNAADRVDCVVFVALREELRPLVPALARRSSHKRDGLKYTIGELAGARVALCRTGIGGELAGQRASLFLAQFRPRVALATGFAGGLSPAWRCEDVIIAETTTALATRTSERGPLRFAGENWELSAHHRELLDELVGRGVARYGRLLSTDSVVNDVAEKATLHRSFGGDAVEMESAALLAAMTAASVPTVCARVILDESDFELPVDFGKILTAEGRPRPIQAMVEVGARPERWRSIAALARRAQRAAAVLGATVPELVRTLVS